ERPGDCGFQSHYATCGHRLDSDGIAFAIPASAGNGDGRRDSDEDAQAAARMVSSEALGVPARLFPGDGIVQRISIATTFWVSREFSLHWGIRGPRLQRPDFSRRGSE